MKAMLLQLVSLTVLTGLASCASVTTQLPDVTLPELEFERRQQEELALIAYKTNAKQYLDVAYPILRDNATLCPRARADIGIMMHKVDSYGKGLRRSSATILGAKDQPRIFQIAEGSPAAKAGLKIGDEFLSPNGEVLDPKSDAFKKSLMAGRDIELRVLREGEALPVTIIPDEICDYKLRLKQTSTINAYADGRNITMTTGMIDFTRTDDELALIIGHELAHNTMGHVRKILSNYILSLGGTRYTRPFESEADYVGLYYSVRAGYSPDGVEDFWRRLARKNPKNVSRAKTHPTFPDRYLRLAATRDEIAEKLRNGDRLIPNFKDAKPIKGQPKS